MEKIQERNFKFLWYPALIGVLSVILCAGCAALGFIMFPLYFVAIALAIAPLGCFLFSLVYKIYFYYQLSLDINEVCKGDGVENKSYLFVLALNTVTLGIYGKYWIYKMAQRLQANAPRYGFKMIVGGKEMVVLDIFSAGWISAWEFVKNMNRIAEVYNNEITGGVQ